MAKSRIAPLKPVTIPRLELTAALVSVKISAILQRELEYEEITETFWTDSKVVIGYISNDARRFHVFVAKSPKEPRSNLTQSVGVSRNRPESSRRCITWPKCTGTHRNLALVDRS